MTYCVYKHLDKDGILLYVGMSKDVIARTTSHKFVSTWYKDISTIKFEHYETKASALEAERNAIKSENPLYNSNCKIKKTVSNGLRKKSKPTESSCKITKKELIKILGDAPIIAKKLEYAHRNVVYGWPDILTDRILADIIRRMKAKRIKVPADWDVK